MADNLRLTVRLSTRQVEHLDELAAEDGVSRSHALRRLLDNAGPGAASGGAAGGRVTSEQALDLLHERARAGSTPAARALLQRADAEEALARLRALTTD